MLTVRQVIQSSYLPILASVLCPPRWVRRAESHSFCQDSKRSSEKGGPTIYVKVNSLRSFDLLPSVQSVVCGVLPPDGMRRNCRLTFELHSREANHKCKTLQINCSQDDIMYFYFYYLMLNLQLYMFLDCTLDYTLHCFYMCCINKVYYYQLLCYAGFAHYHITTFCTTLIPT